MGIYELRRDLNIPGAHELVMQYADGGKSEIFIMGDIRAKVPGGAGQDEIAAALQAAIDQRKSA